MSDGVFGVGKHCSLSLRSFPKPWFQENDASHHIHKNYIIAGDFSCAVVTVAGISGLFLCHHHCGWCLGTFLVPSLLWLASRDFSCAVIAVAGVSGLFKLKLNLAGTGALILLHFQCETCNERKKCPGPGQSYGSSISALY
eukprot:scaffold8419_cov62-Attheya_sp.AAC.11